MSKLIFASLIQTLPFLSLSRVVLIILFVHSNAILSRSARAITEENDDDYQHAHQSLIFFLKNILDEGNNYERAMLLNQLREYLNRMCVNGLFGVTHAESCQRIVDVLHQQQRLNDDETSDTSNERHGIQKRFFCNGFIGCKSASG